MVKITGLELAGIRNDHKKTPGTQSPGLFGNVINSTTNRLEGQRQLVHDEIGVVEFITFSKSPGWFFWGSLFQICHSSIMVFT